ncbi:hypothetical protein PMAYCL1PPCAC_03189, partial [Pristionchus mayeri]
EIFSFTVYNDDIERFNMYNDGRDATISFFQSVRSIFIDGSSPDPGELMDRYRKDGDINDLLEAKRSLHKKLRHLTMAAKVVSARLPRKKMMTSDSPMDISCQGFLDKSRQKIEDINIKLKEVERLLSYHGMKHGLAKVKIHEQEVFKLAARYMVVGQSLLHFVNAIRSSDVPSRWSDVRAKVDLQFLLKQDAEEHWDHCYKEDKHKRHDVVALSAECKSAATSFLPHLRLLPWPENYRQLLLQCSDRHLDGCTMYERIRGLDIDGLLKVEGASLEAFADLSTAHEFNQLCSTTSLLDKVTCESAKRHWPLYLLPQRCYDRLTRDLFDSGLVICNDYEAIDRQMHEYDTIQLSIIPETSHQSRIERLMRMESALMDYGSLEWMEWLARRLRYYDYNEEVIGFYHRSIAERDCCVQDERLVKRIREAFKECAPATINAEKMALDAFIYSTMDMLEKFRRLVVIEAPHASNEAHEQLEHFIRSIRMPPTVAINS